MFQNWRANNLLSWSEFQTNLLRSKRSALNNIGIYFTAAICAQIQALTQRRAMSESGRLLPKVSFPMVVDFIR